MKITKLSKKSFGSQLLVAAGCCCNTCTCTTCCWSGSSGKEVISAA